MNNSTRSKKQRLSYAVDTDPAVAQITNTSVVQHESPSMERDSDTDLSTQTYKVLLTVSYGCVMHEGKYYITASNTSGSFTHHITSNVKFSKKIITFADILPYIKSFFIKITNSCYI